VTPLAGQAIPPLVDEITLRRVATGPGATGDHFPGHWDVEYARSQGQPTVYANSEQVFALVDRAALEWAGPTAFLVRRAVQLQFSAYAGDTLTVTGTVVGTRPDGHVDLEMAVTNQHGGIICTAEVTLRLQHP